MKYLRREKYDHYPRSYPDPKDWLTEIPKGDNVVVLEKGVYDSCSEQHGTLQIQIATHLLFRHRSNSNVLISDLAKWLGKPVVYVALREEEIKPPVNKGKQKCTR